MGLRLTPYSGLPLRLSRPICLLSWPWMTPYNGSKKKSLLNFLPCRLDTSEFVQPAVAAVLCTPCMQAGYIWIHSTCCCSCLVHSCQWLNYSPLWGSTTPFLPLVGSTANNLLVHTSTAGQLFTIQHHYDSCILLLPIDSNWHSCCSPTWFLSSVRCCQPTWLHHPPFSSTSLALLAEWNMMKPSCVVCILFHFAFSGSRKVGSGLTSEEHPSEHWSILLSQTRVVQNAGVSA